MKSLPLTGQIDWGTPLTEYLGQLRNSETGSINFLDTDPSNDTWGADEEGYTYVDMGNLELKTWALVEGRWTWYTLLKGSGSGKNSAGQNSNIYIFGDREIPPAGFTWTGQTFTVSTGSGLWQEKAASPENKAWQVGSIYNNKVYVFAGTSNTSYTYNIATNDYTYLSSIPAPRHLPAYGDNYYDGKFYLVGGSTYLEGVGPSKSLGLQSSLYIYSVTTNTWTTGASYPFPARGMGGCWCSGKYYVFGGNSLDSQLDTGFMENRAFKYDPVADNWTSIAVMPGRRSTPACVAMGTDIYIFGGIDVPSNSLPGTDYNNAWKYNTLTNTYTALANMPFTARAQAAAVITDKIYLIGGIRNDTYLSNVIEYDTVANTYVTKNPMPRAGWGSTIGVAAGIIYAVDASFSKVTQSFDAGGDTLYYVHQQR